MRKKQFPVGRVCENTEWRDRCIAEFVPLWQHYDNYLRHAQPGTFGIEALLEVQQTIFNQLAMTWRWLPPGQRREFEDGCAPMWRDYCALNDRNRQRAIRQRKERANAQEA